MVHLRAFYDKDTNLLSLVPSSAYLTIIWEGGGLTLLMRLPKSLINSAVFDFHPWPIDLITNVFIQLQQQQHQHQQQQH